MKTKNRNKMIAFTVAGLFTVTGVYNAVVMNSDSHLSRTEVGFVKRLDEVYGITVRGREVASSVQWKKISTNNVAQVKSSVINNIENNQTPFVGPEMAALQEELNMGLVEVINPEKFKNGLAEGSFNGSLATNNGIIETLSVSLPNGEGLSVSFSEMTGNVFEYDMNGEKFSGMIYQVDQFAYMVNLTNGPLEGTKLRFATQAPETQQTELRNTLAENNNVDIGSFGTDQRVAELAPEQMLNQDQSFQQQAAQGQSFKF